MSRQTISNRTVIVTGAGRGIGAAIASALAAMGARLGLLDVDRNSLAESANRLSTDGTKVYAAPCDLMDFASIGPAVTAIRAALGPIAGLVNNAGIIQLKALSDTTAQDFDRTIAINLRAPFLLIQQVAEDMKAARWGRIVNIGSSAGKTGGSSAQGVYGTSKAGVICLTKSYARELAPHGVTVNSVSPALIETEMITGLAHLVSAVPLGRLGQPEDVADAVAFLMSDRANFITGEDLDVNGGFLMD